MNQELVMMFNGDETARLTSDPTQEVTADGVIAAFYNEMQRSIQAAVENVGMDVDPSVDAHNFVSFKDVDCSVLNASNIPETVDTVNSVLNDSNLKFIEESQCAVLPEESSLKVKVVEIPDSWKIAVLESNGVISHSAEPLLENEKEVYQLWECPKCTALFREKEVCEQHVDRAHDFSCGLCSEPFSEKDAFENHIIKHISEISSQTQEHGSNAVAITETSKGETLGVEITNTVTNEETIESKVADSDSKNPVEQVFLCENCNLSFSSAHDLEKHKECHIDEDSSSQFREAEAAPVEIISEDSSSRAKPQHNCHECEKVFFTKNALLLHTKKRHASTGEKKFVCEECGKCFKWKLSLENHQVVEHGKQRGFRCQVCSKVCFGKEEWKLHAQSHKQYRNHLTCDFCGATFSQSVQLLKHIKVVHPSVKEFSCTSCGKSFKSRMYLDAHVMEVHSSDYQYQT